MLFSSRTTRNRVYFPRVRAHIYVRRLINVRIKFLSRTEPMHRNVVSCFRF